MDRIISWAIDSFSYIFQPFLSDLWQNIDFWRISSITLLLFIAVVWKLRKNIIDLSYSSKEHDIKIFKQSNKILSEPQLVYMGDSLIEKHSIIDQAYYDGIVTWCVFFQETGNQFLDNRIRSKHKTCYSALDELGEFIHHNFMFIENKQKSVQRHLHPTLNPQITQNISEADKEAFSEYVEALTQLTKKTLTEYMKYREIIKKILKI